MGGRWARLCVVSAITVGVERAPHAQSTNNILELVSVRLWPSRRSHDSLHLKERSQVEDLPQAHGEEHRGLDQREVEQPRLGAPRYLFVRLVLRAERQAKLRGAPAPRQHGVQRAQG
eukprot:4466314-Prymnesium_polylepis.1